MIYPSLTATDPMDIHKHHVGCPVFVRPPMTPYCRLTNITVGIPNVYYFGQEGLHNILVIDLLGPSLEDLFDHCGRKFSVKTTVMIAKQMVSEGATVYSSSALMRRRFPECKQYTKRTSYTAISNPTTS